ncbi:hypothetical protein J4221_02740 [Candidatus Pacearchaeota archaeon]|nr:hypothetical protein [Candidatus Pacearchaeota archaeon]
MFGFFKKKVEKKEIEQLKQAVQTGFNSVKQDMNNLTKWIKHLDSRDNIIVKDFKQEIQNIHDDISRLNEDMENLKNMISVVGKRPLFKHEQTLFNKQTVVDGVLNTVQTGVQTLFLDRLTPNERVIVFTLLNSDMKLSYEDLAAMLGKNKATIRGQVNSIKQKSEGLIEEFIGGGNKKRVYIPENIKEMLIKKRKVRDGSRKRTKENNR